MESFTSTLLLGILIIYLIYISIKNYQVRKFRDDVIDLSIKHERSRAHLALEFRGLFHYNKLPNYIFMLFNFKLLELEAYFTEEEIKELEGELE